MSKRILSFTLCLLAVISLASCAKKKTADAETEKQYIEVDYDLTTEASLASFESGENKYACYLFESTSADNAGGADIVLADGKNNVIQVIAIPKQDDYCIDLDFKFAHDSATSMDLDFDGDLDLYVPVSITGPNFQVKCYLWNAEKGQLEYSEELSKIPELAVDEKNKLLTGMDNTSEYGAVVTEYQWKDGSLVKTAEYAAE